MADVRDLTMRVDVDCQRCNGTGLEKETYVHGDGKPGKDKEIQYLCDCVTTVVAAS